MAQTIGQSGSATEVEFHFRCKHKHMKTSRLSKFVKNLIVDMSPNENCRFCGCSFKVKYGSYISSENLFRASKRSDAYGVILSDVCARIGIKLFDVWLDLYIGKME